MFLFVSCTIADMEGHDRKRLAREVLARRVELGMLTTKALAERADLSPRMLGDVENGRRDNFSPGAKAQIERALRWDAGSIDDILAGKGPKVSGVIRGRGGKRIEEFRAIDGGEQDNLQRLRLGSIILDARDLAHSQSGPLMTALAAILDEASELVIKVLAERDGDAEDLANTRWRIDQVRAGNSIRRQGNIYVVDDENAASSGRVDVAYVPAADPAAGTGGFIQSAGLTSNEIAEVVWPPAVSMVEKIDDKLSRTLSGDILAEYRLGVAELKQQLGTEDGVKNYMDLAHRMSLSVGRELEVFDLMGRFGPAQVTQGLRMSLDNRGITLSEEHLPARGLDDAPPTQSDVDLVARRLKKGQHRTQPEQGVAPDGGA